MDLKPKEIEILKLIREFYMDKYNNLTTDEAYEEAYREIAMLGVRGIKCHKIIFTTYIKPAFYKLTISLNRPGILIGKAGENIKALEKYLSDKLDKQAVIEIHESMIDSYLLPIDYSGI